MSFCRTMILIAAGAALAGCAATVPQRPGSTGPEAPGAAGTAAGDAREVVVEAEGTAHMGDKDRREDVEARAEQEAIEQAARKAFGLRVQEIVETDVGILIKDTKTQTVVGTFTSVSRIDEEFDGSRYRIRIRAEGRRWVGAARPTGGSSPEGREQAVKTEAAPPAASSGSAAGSASAPASPAGEASGATPASGAAPAGAALAAAAPAAGQAEAAKTGAAPARPMVSSRPRDAVTVCCRGFPRTLVKRVRDTRSVLERARGVVRVEEVETTGADLCYRIHHDGSLASIDEWIEQLRTDAALPFKRRHDRGARTIDLVFDAGFD